MVFLHGLDLRRVRADQGLALGPQALQAVFLLAALFLQTTLLGRQHLNALLHLHDLLVLLLRLRLGTVHGLFQGRQTIGLLLHLRIQ